MNAPEQPYYETSRAVSEYLLFHYGKHHEQLPYSFGPTSALDYPVRCVSKCLNPDTLPKEARGLDLGCAVGRASFEMARYCTEVIGIDFSQAFIDRANQLKSDGKCRYDYTEEGTIQHQALAEIMPEIDRSRVHFQQGDAMSLPQGLGRFHVVLMANLIDRLHQPSKCLQQLANLMEEGGQLIITSPYTWLQEYTPSNHWTGGFESDGKRVWTLDGLKHHLEEAFEWQCSKDLPFIIREHARKYQWSVAQASVWRRR
ncbi:MAG: putative 4-mercaptohistidine N1-methyltransferase [Verrucomicrobiota bacterium]|nr:putative 4-mercaptohistidine N1-methyltransferase [Verrucomicrobiota bacterium]